MPILAPLPKQLEKQLEKEIDNFFTHAVEIYLDDLIQKGIKRIHHSEERDLLTLLNHFIEEVKIADFSSQKLEGELACINWWKKEFTKKILIPKYLTHNYNLSLDHLTQLIKNAILESATKKKIAYYIQVCQKGLIQALKNIEPTRRLLTAKHIVDTSLKEYQKNDRSFPKDAFLKAFDQDHLKTLLNTIPIRSSSLFGMEDEQLIENVNKHVTDQIKKRLLEEKKAPLTKQLQIINQFLVTLEKERDPLPLWGIENVKLTPQLKKKLSLTILEEKAHIFLNSYLKEVEEAKKRAPFETFAKLREAILNKYLIHYIHNHHPQLKYVREYFLEQLKEKEKNTRFSSFQEEEPSYKEPPLLKPKKSKRWKKV